jgi:hypothetical protein
MPPPTEVGDSNRILAMPKLEISYVCRTVYTKCNLGKRKNAPLKNIENLVVIVGKIELIA